MSEEERTAVPGDRIAGITLASAAAASVLVMAHHPADAHSAALGGMVHAAMIVLLSATTFGFAHFWVRRGLGQPLILAGLVAYMLSLFGHIGAATINGFVVPALAIGHDNVGHDIFVFAWESNQALARLGVFATSFAFVFWAVDFLRRVGIEPRIIGLAGLAAGFVPAFLLLSGSIAMDLAGAFIVYGLQAAWSVLVGLHLLRGKLPA